MRSLSRQPIAGQEILVSGLRGAQIDSNQRLM
jgi:hypothetical protein